MTSGIKLCGRCGHAFYCGVAAGEPTCWCFLEPHTLPLDPNAQCLCPDCLKWAIAAFRLMNDCKKSKPTLEKTDDLV